VGKKSRSKDYILEFALLIKDLNSKLNNKKKLKRINIIIDWLKNLKDLPKMEDKLNLINLIKISSINI
jgi:hypothetical protein